MKEDGLSAIQGTGQETVEEPVDMKDLLEMIVQKFRDKRIILKKDHTIKNCRKKFES